MLVIKMMTSMMIVIMMIQALIFKFSELQQETAGGKVDRGSEEFHAIKELAKRFALSFGLDALKNREAVTGLHREVMMIMILIKIVP